MTIRDAMKPKFKAQSKQAVLLLGLTVLIVVVGLIMVASASAVDSYKETDNAAFTFLRQGLYVLVGFAGLVFLSNLKLDFFRRMAPPVLLGMLVLQLVTAFFGVEINGNRNWLDIGITTIQPAEFLKIALIVALALQLAQLNQDPETDKQIWRMVLGVSAVAVGLVALIGRDLGTGVVIGVTLMAMFLFAGMPLSRWLGLSALIVAGAVAAIMSSASRRIRFEAWLNPDGADPMGVMWQFEKGTWALAAGGFWGTGLGRSKLKWSWIPEVENDFIFAIIGEELGLLGAIGVIGLYFALAMVLFSIAKQQTNAFSRNLVAGVMVWISMQAFINIGVVLGLFPVLGVPLPLISAGGSSTIATLAGIGIVLAVERDRINGPARKLR
ncbi:MAG: FtsW/RodA/SpoVE family cell cycle protein [Aquiluna sp.]|jgi:cell division protein FtsW